MPLSKTLTLGLAGSLCALTLALVAGPSTAQSRFDGKNDVPGAVIVDPDNQKINPDTIPEFPSTGDTSIRPRFYMSPGSRCTELEDPLPGGCEANNLQRDSSAGELIEGEISPFTLVLAPLPPVALTPLPSLTITTHLPQFVVHPVLPRSLALPLIVKPAQNVPAIHIVLLSEPSTVSRLPRATAPLLNAHAFPTPRGFIHVFPGFSSAPASSSPVAGLEAAVATKGSGHTGISTQTLSTTVPGFSFLKDRSAAREALLSARDAQVSALFQDNNLSGHRIAHPLRSSLLPGVAREPVTTHPGLFHGVFHNELTPRRHADLSRGPLVSVVIAPPRPSFKPKTVVKFLLRETTIIQGSSPYAHGVTLSHPTAFALH